MNLLIQQIINGVMLGAIYVAVAMAFTLTIGILNFLNFTIPALFMLTGMVGWAASAYGLPFGLSGPVGWIGALCIGIAVSTLASLLVERFTYRYLKNKFGDASEHAIPLVSSLGFLLIFENIIRMWLGTDPHRFTTPFHDTNISVSGILVSVPQAISLVVALVVVFGLTTLLRTTRTGRALRAIAENADAANILGIDVSRIVPIVFVFTGLLCGLAAAIFAINYGEVSAGMGDEIGTKAIAGMVVGGLGSIWGAVVGGLAVGIVETLSIHWFGADTINVTVWGLLLLVLVVRPQGFFGHHAIGKGKL